MAETEAEGANGEFQRLLLLYLLATAEQRQMILFLLRLQVRVE